MDSARLRPSLAGVSPAMRWRSRPGDRRKAWTVGMSLLLHALAIAALLSIPRREQGETSTAPSYELMFEGGQGAPAPPTPADTAPPPAPDLPEAPPSPPPSPPPAPAPPEADVLPGPESPAPEAPPDASTPPQPPPAPPQDTAQAAPQIVPQAGPSPTEAVPPATPPPAVPAEPAPAPPAEAPDIQAPPAEVAPPEPAPAPARPPDVRLDEPQLPEPTSPAVPERAAPNLPAPPPLPPRPRPRTAPPKAPPGTLGNPMDLSFNSAPSRPAAPRTTAPRGSVASRSLDLSPGVPKGPDRSDMFFDARAARIGGDWREALKAYWLNHRYYPRQAAENGEDGSVDVELTVGGNGRVQSVVLKSHSGSMFIDMAAVGTWRNAQLPPLPPELSNPYTFTITINYILVR